MIKVKFYKEYKGKKTFLLEKELALEEIDIYKRCLKKQIKEEMEKLNGYEDFSCVCSEQDNLVGENVVRTITMFCKKKSKH